MKQPAFVGLKTNRGTELEASNIIVKFKSLKLLEQCNIVIEILNLLTHQKTTFALKKLNITASRTKLSMNLTKLKEFTIITQSVTGLQKNEIRII